MALCQIFDRILVHFENIYYTCAQIVFEGRKAKKMQRSALHEKFGFPLPGGGMKTTRRANARGEKDGSALLWEGVRTPLDFCAEENYFLCGRKNIFVRKKIYFRAEENYFSFGRKSGQERNIYNLLINNQLA